MPEIELSDPAGSAPRGGRARLRLAVRGLVQGVGFRPFVYRLASELGLTGWVSNSASGVVVEAEASRAELERFLQRLQREKPPHSLIQSLETCWREPAGYAGFQIRESEAAEGKKTLVLPDLATCPDCLREIVDPGNRRYRYPFTNCTNCGPRFTIIERLPYDRANTSMKRFVMCAACQDEYDDPGDRRFHAQPNACPVCGPRLEVWDRAGRGLSTGPEGLEAVAEAIRQGRIVAVKGLGGFHLIVAAHRADSIAQLRERKHREEKPFALLFGSVEQVRLECQVSELEETLLRAAQAPIVLLRRRPSPDEGPRPAAGWAVAASVAPGNPYLGAMLPCTPLHHVLMDLLGFPVVATSGNRSEEPICIDEREAVERLGGMADLFLVHNRPIVRHADDSIVRVMGGREVVLRRARGYAPLPVSLGGAGGAAAGLEGALPSEAVLAVGAHLKNSIALATGGEVFLSQHIGDMETPQACAAFERVIADLESFYEVQPPIVAADLHPDYLSTRYAGQTGRRVVRVQHHYAHVLACMAEHGIAKDVLGVSWDGTGYGTDGTVWGGEFLVVTEHGFERMAHLRTFRLPGGEQAVKEPRRSALGILDELFGEEAFGMRELAPVRAFSAVELAVIRRMLDRNLNTPVTSSAGRLFDAVAALLDLRQRAAFEGQAAMGLEFLLETAGPGEAYPMALVEPAAGRPMIVDWGPAVRGIIDDLQKRLPAPMISMKFHRSLVEAIVRVAQRAGNQNVLLSGGCFQNKYLTERSVLRLEQAGFRVYWHRWVPPNDGGIALGQVLAVRRLAGKKD